MFGVPTFGVHCMSRASYTKVQNQLLEFPASRRLQTLLHARLRDAQECSLGFKGRRFVVVLNLHIALEAGDLVSLGLFLPSYRTLLQLQVSSLKFQDNLQPQHKPQMAASLRASRQRWAGPLQPSITHPTSRRHIHNCHDLFLTIVLLFLFLFLLST